MTSTGRTAQRVPSRTPPFVLIGLLVVLSFLGYSYWSLSSSNSDLSAQLEAIRVEKRDSQNKQSEVQRMLVDTKSQLSAFQIESNQLKRDLLAKDAEVQSLKADIAQKVADDDKQKSLMEQCDEKLNTLQRDFEISNDEKAKLQETLDAERGKTAICSMEACLDPVQQVLMVASKIVGSDKMHQALVDANLAADQLMKGITYPAPPVEKLQEPPQTDKASEAKENVAEGQQTNVEKVESATNIKAQLNQSSQAIPEKPQVYSSREEGARRLSQNLLDLQRYTENFQKSIGNTGEVISTGQSLNMAFDTQVEEAKNQESDDNGSFPSDQAQDEGTERNRNVDTNIDRELAHEMQEKSQHLDTPMEVKTGVDGAAFMKYGKPLPNLQTKFVENGKPDETGDEQPVFVKDGKEIPREEQTLPDQNIGANEAWRSEKIDDASTDFFQGNDQERLLRQFDSLQRNNELRGFEDEGAEMIEPQVLSDENQKAA
ncbi:protein casc4-like isoform x6 [Plakobranchus ocellatus]|uniref:Protein casc4-like isoform x6 n=1 Tax=Plakobranchus ocellatus TaxID=259542 RepID=A0AAV4CYU9_9GAST|nr:protein casc4-like isoform x6 [Plakobranchus ocellatus]